MRFKKIYIEITNKCNLSCDFCVPHKRECRDMSVEDFKIVLEKIKPYTDYIYLHVKGEPLIHPDFKELCKIAFDMGFKVNITTNGTYISKIMEVKDYVRQVNISLHATNDTEIVKKAKEITGCYMNFRVWNGSNSTFENNKTIEILAKEFDIDILSILSQKMAKNGENEANKEVNFTIKDNFYCSVQNEWEWPDISSNMVSNGYCHALKDHIAILVDGTVIPCCLDNNGDINLGNIFDEELGEILASERVLAMLEGFKSRKCVEELCQKCTYKLKFS